MTFFRGTPQIDAPMLTELIYILSLQTLEIVRRICGDRWIIRMDGDRERESPKSDLSTSLDDEVYIYIYIYIYQNIIKITGKPDKLTLTMESAMICRPLFKKNSSSEWKKLNKKRNIIVVSVGLFNFLVTFNHLVRFTKIYHLSILISFQNWLEKYEFSLMLFIFLFLLD